MNCRRVEKLIPLFVGNDLDEDDLALVKAHAGYCADCRISIKQYEQSRQWLRGLEAPELDGAVLSQFRRDIVERLDDRPIRFTFSLHINSLEAAFVAVLLLLTLIAGLIYFPRTRSAAQLAEQELGLPSPSLQSDREPEAPAVHAVIHGAHGTGRRRPHNRERELVSTNEPSESIEDRMPSLRTAAPVRIEIQTADPSIRIIWFAAGSADLSKSISEE